MPPQPVTFPHRRFVVTQTIDGVETNLISSTPLPVNYTSDQVERKYAIDSAWAAKNTEPGVLYRIYGPTNGNNVAHTDGDCIWRSDIEYG